MWEREDSSKKMNQARAMQRDSPVKYKPPDQLVSSNVHKTQSQDLKKANEKNQSSSVSLLSGDNENTDENTINRIDLYVNKEKNILKEFSEHRKGNVDMNENIFFQSRLAERIEREKQMKNAKKNGSNKNAAPSLSGSKSASSSKGTLSSTQPISSTQRLLKSSSKGGKQKASIRETASDKAMKFISTKFSQPQQISDSFEISQQTSEIDQDGKSATQPYQRESCYSVESTNQYRECELIYNSLNQASITSASISSTTPSSARKVPFMATLTRALICPSDTPIELRREVICGGEVGYGYRLMENPLPEKLWRTFKRVASGKIKKKKRGNTSKK